MSKYNINFNYDYLRTSESKYVDREKDPEPGKCNNFNDRKVDSMPTWIMQHHTVTNNIHNALNTFLNGRVSTHYLIARDGTVYNLVNDEKRAYHAGNGHLKSGSQLNKLLSDDQLKSHNERGDMNSWSIGIENENNAFEPYSPEQIKANIYLCEELVKKHKISPKNLLSHAEWSIGNKVDPSPYFPWEEFANASTKYDYIEHNFGIYPKKTIKAEPSVIVAYNQTCQKEAIEHLQSQFEELGYSVLTEDQANLGKYDQKTRDAAFAFTIRYLNQSVTSDEKKLQCWKKVDDPIEKETARSEIAIWTENHDIVMGDVLDQYSE